jgi:hypothetical protein
MKESKITTKISDDEMSYYRMINLLADNLNSNYFNKRETSDKVLLRLKEIVEETGNNVHTPLGNINHPEVFHYAFLLAPKNLPENFGLIHLIAAVKDDESKTGIKPPAINPHLSYKEPEGDDEITLVYTEEDCFE